MSDQIDMLKATIAHLREQLRKTEELYNATAKESSDRQDEIERLRAILRQISQATENGRLRAAMRQLQEARAATAVKPEDPAAE